MGEERDLGPLWGKLAEQGKEIQAVKMQTELNTRMLESHVEEFRKMNRDQSSAHGEAMKAIELIAKDVKTVMNDFHQRRGAQQITRWLIPVLVSAVALLLAYIKLNQ